MSPLDSPGPPGPDIEGPPGPYIEGPPGPDIEGPPGPDIEGPPGPDIEGPPGPDSPGPPGPEIAGYSVGFSFERIMYMYILHICLDIVSKSIPGGNEADRPFHVEAASNATKARKNVFILSLKFYI